MNVEAGLGGDTATRPRTPGPLRLEEEEAPLPRPGLQTPTPTVACPQCVLGVPVTSPACRGAWQLVAGNPRGGCRIGGAGGGP